jgi:hypothetical protein
MHQTFLLFSECKSLFKMARCIFGLNCVENVGTSSHNSMGFHYLLQGYSTFLCPQIYCICSPELNQTIVKGPGNCFQVSFFSPAQEVWPRNLYCRTNLLYEAGILLWNKQSSDMISANETFLQVESKGFSRCHIP